MLCSRACSSRLPYRRTLNPITQTISRNERLTIVRAVEYAGFDDAGAGPDIHAGNPIYETEVLRSLREQRSAIRVGDILREDSVEKSSSVIKEWLASKGYPKAVVSVDVTAQPKEWVKLRYSIDRGPIVKVGEIRFTGNKNISGDDFVSDLKACLKGDPDIYDASKYEYCAQKSSRGLMYSSGYFRGKINAVTAKLIGDRYEISIAVDEGDRYRWGKIEVKASKAFSESEILQMFGKTAGEIADGKALQDFMFDTLKRRYEEKGYVQFAAEFDPEFVDPQTTGGDDGIVNVLMTIDEGKSFTIRKIAFTGIEAREGKSLANGFSLKPGDVFIPGKLEEGIEKINDRGQYFRADKDRDVEIRTDEEGGTLDVFINLKKID